MMHTEQIKKILSEGIVCEYVYVAGEGDNFEALLVSSEFEGKNRVERQQMVNVLLRSYFDSGQLHAFSMKTVTPAEWEARRG
jgi:acid stress-induced BolA-like protein IbaG/YrbA